MANGAVLVRVLVLTILVVASDARVSAQALQLRVMGAAVDDDMLAVAQESARALLGTAGLRALWMDCRRQNCGAGDADHGVIEIHLLPILKLTQPGASA